MSTSPYPSVYPVRVDATLEDRLSRWLWLVKWFLAIPHYVVLALLWLAFVVLSVVAFGAIVITGRYPRGIFDFNVGVLRWSWRVAYYTYGGLGTDRYPPFSLQDVPDYPAHLEVEYPAQLSRGLALVKWWLLAIPHYLVLGLFLGSGWYVASASEADARAAGFGLIGLLVLVAAVVLLVTGRYPRSVFDLVLGLNRWVLRVAAYVSLMTDTYPPFRLDLGGTDPATALATTPPSAPSEAPSEAPPVTSSAPPAGQVPPGRWGAGRVVAVVIGSILLLTGLGTLVGGGALRLADSALRDADGYLMSSSVRVDSPGYAVTSGSLQLHGGVSALDLPDRLLGTVRVEVTGNTPNGVFAGIARTEDAERYLEGVASSAVLDPVDDEGNPTLEFTDGGSPPVEPTEADFWVESAAGPGLQTLTWSPRSGDWTLVVMNGEGTTPVSADVAVGATAPAVDDVALALLFTGLLLSALATALLVAALRRPNW